MSPHLRSALAALAALCAGIPALAEPAVDTPAAPACRTWLPDFACQREARPPGFIPPMTMPYLFEEPFITTGASGYVIYHEFPNESAFQGGDAWVVALQGRVAITDRLAFIATKDGVMVTHPDDDSELESQTGLLNISAGLKYALIDLREKNFILTPSFRLEVPSGTHNVFSGHGSGVAIPAVSTGWGIGGAHVLGAFGAQLPFTSAQSTSLFYGVQLDYALWKYLSPFFAVNGMHYLASGGGHLDVDTQSFGSVPLSAAQDVLFGAGITDRRRWEGNDVLNLGSDGVAGNDVVTVGFGARVPLNRHVSLGGSYEFPVTDREDLFDQRVSFNAVVEF